MRFSSYVVDTEDLPAHDRANVCRVVVRTLGGTAIRFQADVPWSQAANWPDAVRQAAELLVASGGGTRAGELYQHTGMLPREDEATWQAFATFAGYAFDASVWSGNRLLPIVELADEGTSVVVRLEEAERKGLEAAVAPVRVVKLKDARAARRRPR